MKPVVGVDPGAKETGIVLIRRSKLLKACTITRPNGTGIPEPDYLTEIIDTITGYTTPDTVISAESLVAPNPHMGLTSVTPLLAAAVVLVAILHTWPDTLLIRPNKNGSRPLSTYPPELRPTRGKGKGTDKLRHVRSAFDVAITAQKTRPK